MENVKSASQAQKIDMAELLLRVDNDLELLRDLFSIFQDDFPRHLQALRRAVSISDLHQVKVASHTMKGTLANLAVSRRLLWLHSWSNWLAQDRPLRYRRHSRSSSERSKDCWWKCRSAGKRHSVEDPNCR